MPSGREEEAKEMGLKRDWRELPKAKEHYAPPQAAAGPSGVNAGAKVEKGDFEKQKEKVRLPHPFEC